MFSATSETVDLKEPMTSNKSTKMRRFSNRANRRANHALTQTITRHYTDEYAALDVQARHESKRGKK